MHFCYFCLDYLHFQPKVREMFLCNAYLLLYEPIIRRDIIDCTLMFFSLLIFLHILF